MKQFIWEPIKPQNSLEYELLDSAITFKTIRIFLILKILKLSSLLNC